MEDRNKIISRDLLKDIIVEFKQKGVVIGFTSGVFDILHKGHISFLEEAKKRCDILIVGVNSNSSVKGIKGDNRPINLDYDRAFVLSALSFIDYVFIFSEKNNNKNIELLQPNIYFKAGDYVKEQLSSAPLVESYGGRVEIIPYKEGISTTNIINKIEHLTLKQFILPGDTLVKTKEKSRAVFVDRDGTIIKHVNYLKDPKLVSPLKNAFAGLKQMQDMGYKIIIVTNQPGIGMGYLTEDDFFAVTKELLRQASQEGILINKIYFSPHTLADRCCCRKPLTSMVEKAIEEENIDPSLSFVIGDSTSDIQLGDNLGIHTILVKTGNKGGDGLCKVSAEYVAEDLLDAASFIKSKHGKAREKPKYLPYNQLVISAIGSCAANIGHDVNNLLASLKKIVEVIKGRVKSDKEVYKKIEQPLTIFDKAIDKGKLFTWKLRSGARLNLPSAIKVSLKDIFTIVLDKIENKSYIKFKNSPFNWKEDIFVYFNPIALEYILFEAISNALRYSLKDNPYCEIAIHIEQSSVELAFANKTESQYSLEEIEALFFSGGYKGVGYGYGLGLPMIKALAQSFGSKIDIFKNHESFVLKFKINRSSLNY